MDIFYHASNNKSNSINFDEFKCALVDFKLKLTQARLSVIWLSRKIARSVKRLYDAFVDRTGLVGEYKT